MSSEINDIEFLGKGWSFPPRFDKVHSSLEISTGDTDIRESLAILLGTVPGERFLHPDYGCDLSDLAFESLTVTLKGDLTDKIQMAITLFESRIKLENVNFETNVAEGIIFIHLTYEIRATNSRTNMVYPYYFKEGTDL
jgi:uncharacterized protein